MIYNCGGYDPYNSAETSAKWKSALITRDAGRILVRMAKLLLNLVFGPFAR